VCECVCVKGVVVVGYVCVSLAREVRWKILTKRTASDKGVCEQHQNVQNKVVRGT